MHASCDQRISSAIEERFGENSGEKNFALIYFSCNFVEEKVNAYVVIHENMVVVHLIKLTELMINRHAVKLMFHKMCYGYCND